MKDLPEVCLQGDSRSCQGDNQYEAFLGPSSPSVPPGFLQQAPPPKSSKPPNSWQLTGTSWASCFTVSSAGIKGMPPPPGHESHLFLFFHWGRCVEPMPRSEVVSLCDLEFMSILLSQSSQCQNSSRATLPGFSSFFSMSSASPGASHSHFCSYLLAWCLPCRSHEVSVFSTGPGAS